MHSSLVLSVAALSLTVSTVAFSQTAFKQPTPERTQNDGRSQELQEPMPVFLDIEENLNDPLHYKKRDCMRASRC